VTNILLSGIPADSRIYLRPIHFVDSPQQHDDDACLRLAGGMLWFSAVELIVNSDARTSRHIVTVREWDATLKKLPAGHAERAAQIMGHLVAPREALQMGDRIVRLDQPKVMGIINATPDSFSDGGKNVDADAAVAAGISMASAGAAILDVGGESTRPGAPLLWEGDEIKRVEQIIAKLASSGNAVSVDTRKAAVMESALSAGARMINDISALLYDDRSVEIAKAADCPVVLMHAPSQSSDPHKGGEYRDVVSEVYDMLEARVEALVASGIARAKILVDPGIGFGKSLSDNLAIINNLSIFHGIGCAILFGASRKRLIGALSNEAAAVQRLGGSIYLAMKAVEQGVQMVRVHDVPETVQAIHVWRGLRDAALTAKA
jgi:dihydropteroate synthase